MLLHVIGGCPVALGRVLNLSVDEATGHFHFAYVLLLFVVLDTEIEAQLPFEQVFTVANGRLVLLVVGIELLVGQLVLDEIAQLAVSVLDVDANFALLGWVRLDVSVGVGQLVQ